MSAHHCNLRTFHAGLIAAWVCLSLAVGLLYSVVIPPWQAPDEPRHLEYAIRLSEKGWPLRSEDLSLDLQREILTSLAKSDFWKFVGREQPDPLPASFAEDPFLIRSGTRLGDKSPLYYFVSALVFRLLPGHDVLFYLYVMRWFSVLLRAATVAVACLVAFQLFPHDRFMMVAVPAFVCLLPMFAFIGASANNDVLATLVASLLIWQVSRVVRNGLTTSSGLTAGGLAVLAALSKVTGAFTLPLVLVAILISLWGRPVLVKRSHKRLLGISGALILLLLGIALSWRGEESAGWVRLPQTMGDTRSDVVARSGSYALRISKGRLMQSLPFNTVRALRGKSVTLEGWVVSSGGDRAGSLLVEDDEGRSTTPFVAGEEWTHDSVTHLVSPHARTIRIMLAAGGQLAEATGYVYFDDLALTEGQKTSSNLLCNGSAEEAARRVRPFLQELNRYVKLRPLLDVRSYDLASLERYLLYVLLTFAGFWANFGWLTLPLHPFWYALLALLTVTSAAGLVSWSVGMLKQRRQNHDWPPDSRDRTLLLFVAGLVLILIQTFLPTIGSPWQPQGRYLFPALVIIATLFTFGVRRLMRTADWRPLAGAYVACFALFDALCLLCYIVPHYYF